MLPHHHCITTQGRKPMCSVVKGSGVWTREGTESLELGMSDQISSKSVIGANCVCLGLRQPREANKKRQNQAAGEAEEAECGFLPDVVFFFLGAPPKIQFWFGLCRDRAAFSLWRLQHSRFPLQYRIKTLTIQ